NRGGEAHPEDDIVQTALENGEQVVAGPARHLAGERHIATQLALADAVVEAHLLLFLEQAAELACLSPARLGLAVLAGRIWLLFRGLAGKAGKLNAEAAEDLEAGTTLGHGAWKWSGGRSFSELDKIDSHRRLRQGDPHGCPFRAVIA